MFHNFRIRSATVADKASINKLINSSLYVHRHLDWRTPIEWLGKNPYWVMEGQTGIRSALSCVPEPEGVGWVRLYATSIFHVLDEDWNDLFAKIIEFFHQNPIKLLPAMGIHEWFSDLVVRQGFEFLQDVVVLKWDNLHLSIPPKIPISIRPAVEKDIQAITEVDAQSFDPLWQIPISAMVLALKQAAYTTVAELDGKIIGYQLSTCKLRNAHLARLAVLPSYQRQSIGQFLVRDMISYFSTSGIDEITVNTQGDNQASLALYGKLNFQLTGDRYPVFLYPM